MQLPVFIHAACMNHWFDILAEQLDCLYEVRYVTNIDFALRINLVGANADARQGVVQLKRVLDMRGDVYNSQNDISDCESPTIRLMRHYAQSDSGPILYMHGKGAAHPSSTWRAYWRWHMHVNLLRRLPEALEKLDTHPWVAASGRLGNEPCPHAAGNYFLTTGAFLQSLPNFDTWRTTTYWQLPGLPPYLQQRHADEMWLGSTYAAGHSLTPLSHEPWDPAWWRRNPEELRHTILQH